MGKAYNRDALRSLFFFTGISVGMQYANMVLCLRKDFYFFMIARKKLRAKSIMRELDIWILSFSPRTTTTTYLSI